MKVGKSLKELRGRKGLSQENMAKDIFVSQQLYSSLESNKSNMSEDLMRSSVHYYDDAQYGYEIARETARDYITPIADSGRAIEWHRLALEEVFISEAEEAINHFRKVSLVKRPDLVTDIEVQSIEDGMKELLDVQTVINSFLSKLEQVYPVSVKQCMKNRIPTWKAKEWVR